MPRTTANLLRAQIDVDDEGVIETLVRGIPQITSDEIFYVLTMFPRHIHAIKETARRTSISQRNSVAVPDYDTNASRSLKTFIKAAMKQVESRGLATANETLMGELLMIVPFMSNDDLIYVMTIMPGNIHYIKDDARRAAIAERYGMEVPEFVKGDGSPYQRFREHIRNVRGKQSKLLDEQGNMDEAEFTSFGAAEVVEIERLPLGKPFDEVDSLFGTDPVSGIAGMPLGMVSLWGGEGGVGKTRFWAGVAGHISRPVSYNEDDYAEGYEGVAEVLNPDDERLLRGLGQGVLFLQLEMAIGQFKNLNNKVINDDCFMICSTANTIMSQDAHIRRAAREFRKAGTHLRLVVIDSVSKTLEMRSHSGLRKTIDHYRKLAQELGIHIALISHLNKSGDIKGSADLSYLPDQVMKLQRLHKKGDFSVTCPSKNRAGETGISIRMTHGKFGVRVVKVGEGHNRGAVQFNNGGQRGGVGGLEAFAAANGIGDGNGRGQVLGALRAATNAGQRGADRGADTATMTQNHQPRQRGDVVEA